MEASHANLATLVNSLDKLASALIDRRISGDQYTRGADYLTSRIESMRDELANGPTTPDLLVIDGHGPSGWDFV